ncbi:hypothetical protein QTU96_002760 [Enterobacter asburiae]|uniref:hypothetical protein n=1 Tax=Enterobacter roggenkampii TaxID=1812935 RepID=UPI0029320285|nr:hypothetical protein [Enterobacter asburiae]
MYKPAPLNHRCVHDVLTRAMSTTTSEESRWDLRCDAECSRDALLDALEFIGVTVQDCTATAEPPPFSKADLKRLAGFLMCAPNLIRGLNAIVEDYADSAAAKGVRHD